MKEHISTTRRILILGMGDSVHLGRWLYQFRDTEFVFHLVSSSPHRRLDPKISELLKSSKQFEISWISRFLSLPLWIFDRIMGDRLRGLLIAWAARNFRPDLIHILEFQNAGYSYLRARQYSRGLNVVPLLLTPYGSDMFWYQRFRHHKAKLETLIPLAAGLSSECERDEKLAYKFGFRGSLLPRIPAFGAIKFPLEQQSQAERKLIAVKGYQNKWGQASNSLRALAQIADQIQDFTVVLFSCNRVTLSMANKFSKSTGLTVVAHKKGTLTHDEMQSIFSQSVLYIGLSKSDGISASMIEAMVNGAVPIQSDTSCCDEWLLDGVGGFLVGYDDVDEVARLALRIVKDPSLRRRAAQVNGKTLRARLSKTTAQKSALATYREFFREN